MRRTGLLLVAGAIAAVAVLCVGAVAPVSSQGSSEIEQLRNEVATLRQRVEALEERLKDATLSAALKESKAGSGVIDPYHGLRQEPPHWKKGEFNGVPYYIVPIDKTHTPAREAPKQVPHDQAPAAPEAAGSR